ncbi:MAG: transaldolase [Bauldia sp.]|nr:transaldolase [Bauldia sp.]
MTAAASTESRLCRLHALGQSVWLDSIGRTMLHDGTLQRLIEEDCVTGITSNPVLFDEAVRRSDAYDAAIAAAAAAGLDAAAIYERLVVEDIRAAADLLRLAYDRSGGRDGFASLEVSPHLARDTEGTIAEAARLWAALGRPNAMIKIPGTAEGLPAIEAAIAAGINVNITLLFDPRRYRAVAAAYFAGLEARLAKGGPLPHSVASFFLSRIDAAIDPLLPDDSRDLRGRAAIAFAREAHGVYAELVATDRWHRLADAGAAPQRLLWASTGVKDPSARDVRYVEALIGPDTVTTLPPKTLDAFRDHGAVAPTLSEGGGTAALRARLREAEMDIAAIMTKLEDEGIGKFVDAFDALHAAIEEKRHAAAQTGDRS